jgi:hypothetical protein
MATFYPDAKGGIAMDDTDLRQAVQKDLQWKPRVDAARRTIRGVPAHRRRV